MRTMPAKTDRAPSGELNMETKAAPPPGRADKDVVDDLVDGRSRGSGFHLPFRTVLSVDDGGIVKGGTLVVEDNNTDLPC